MKYEPGDNNIDKMECMGGGGRAANRVEERRKKQKSNHWSSSGTRHMTMTEKKISRPGFLTLIQCSGFFNVGIAQCFSLSLSHTFFLSLIFVLFANNQMVCEQKNLFFQVFDSIPVLNNVKNKL